MRRFYADEWLETRLCRVYERLRGDNIGIVCRTLCLVEKERLSPVCTAVTDNAGDCDKKRNSKYAYKFSSVAVRKKRFLLIFAFSFFFAGRQTPILSPNENLSPTPYTYHNYT